MNFIPIPSSYNMESTLRSSTRTHFPPSFVSTLLPKSCHFSFITMHYTLIIGIGFFASICLYSTGNISYIDALFLASGAATQSGLNTIDINLLKTWQQLVLYIVPMITNPITINTSIVFLRLWWFEKKFQHVVREARKTRRSIYKTFSRTKTNDQDYEQEENGLHVKKIRIRNSPPANLESIPSIDPPSDNQDILGKIPERSGSLSNISEVAKTNDENTPENALNELMQRQIKFADQVNVEGTLSVTSRLPLSRPKEEHIAVLQRQRNVEDGEVLWIPGPRDADAGVPPQSVKYDLHPSLNRRGSGIHVNEEYERSSIYNQPRRSKSISLPRKDPPMSPAKNVVQNNTALISLLRLFKHRKRGDTLTGKLHDTHRRSSIQNVRSALTRSKDEISPYLSWQPTIGRNSAFPDLTEEQRDELGGIEYRSLKTLAVVLVSYFWGFTLLGVICLVPWILRDEVHGSIVKDNGQGRPWWGVFTANSAFTDLGFTLTPDSMISFQLAIWPLLLMSFLIAIGNTAFPIMLRIIIWIGSRFSPAGSGLEQELNFLLDHPRRCFTLLFPANATLWLAALLFILSAVDVLFFIILDLGKTIVTQLPPGIRVLDGLFQAISTRTAGFAVVDLSLLHPAIQVSYLVMMYISVFPIAISVRRTNVYEERSLGIYNLPTDEEEQETYHSYVATHLRHQLSFDLWYICLGFFIIAISEGSRLQSGDPRFTMFAVLFEIISAYGTVGLSLGYKDINASFSAEFGVIAKIVIIAMQIRGRHRGLPNELDRAIILPSETLQQKAEEDTSRLAQRRRNSNVTERALSLSRTFSKGQASGLLGAVFQPGPPLPRSYRNLRRENSHVLRSSSVSTSI